MSRFNLNIDLFYQSELESGNELKAIATLEYPIIHLIARTEENTKDDYDHLDRFILETALKFNGFRSLDFENLTGLKKEIFNFRGNELVKQGYLTHIEDGLYILTTNGEKQAKEPKIERLVVKTRSFLVDGIDHQPIPKYFYTEGKPFLISEEQVDRRGNKKYSPSIIHTPPNNLTTHNIMEIDIADRSKYNLPTGLKRLFDYDFHLMTFPIGIAMFKRKNGEITKKVINCFEFYSEYEVLDTISKKIENEISHLEVDILEYDVEKEDKKSKRTLFGNNWSKLRKESTNKIFNIDKSKLIKIIQREYYLDDGIFDPDWLTVSEDSINLTVTEKLLNISTNNKKRLLDSCVRGRDYIRQHPQTGVWLTFLNIRINDKYISELVEFYTTLNSEPSPAALVSRINNDIPKLRKMLIDIGRFDLLESVDIYLFMYTRESHAIKSVVIDDK